MALSGSLSTNKYNNIMGLKFSWTSAGQSIVDNTTTINWTLESEGGSDYSYYTGNLTLIVDGDTVLSIPSKFLMQGGGAWSKSGQITLKHNDDGKRSFSVSIAAGIYTYGAVNCTASTTFTIDQIKRRSVIAGSNGTLGSSNKLTLTRYNDAFTDTITATCGTESTTIATGSTATSVTWTPPVEWAAQNVSATSVTVTVTCKTYSGSTLLGYTSVTLTFAIPASVVPTVSLAVSDAKGYLSTYGGYIQNKSQAKVTATAEGVYGSSIKSYTIVCGSQSGTGSSGTFDLPSSGKITVKVTVMDSRGRSASASTEITVIAYAAPSVEITSRYRCDADGNEDYLGTYAIAVFTAAVTSLSGKNSAAYTLKYRVRGTSAWTSIALDSLAGNYAQTAASQIFPADIDSSYDVCIVATDNFGTIESAYRTIQLAKPLMDFDRDIRAIAFLQRAVDANTIAFGDYVKFNAGTSLMTESAEYPGCYYRVVNDQTEWINPPLVEGEEYRTVRRYKGATVFEKILNIGNLPDSTAAIRVAHGITGASEFPAVKVIATAASSVNRLVFDYGGGTAKAWVEGSNVVVDATADLSDYTGIACLEYIKS